jgi:hypothetical protein
MVGAGCWSRCVSEASRCDADVRGAIYERWQGVKSSEQRAAKK